MFATFVLRVLFAVLSASFMVGLGFWPSNTQIANSFIFEVISWILYNHQGLSWLLWFLEDHRDKPDPLYENQPIIIYCIHTSVLIKPGWLRWPQSSGSSVPQRIRSVSSHVTISTVWTYSNYNKTRAIETMTIMSSQA